MIQKPFEANLGKCRFLYAGFYCLYCITKLFGASFFYLHNLRHMRKYLSRHVAERFTPTFLWLPDSTTATANFTLLPDRQIQKVVNVPKMVVLDYLRSAQIFPLQSPFFTVTLVTIKTANRVQDFSPDLYKVLHGCSTDYWNESIIVMPRSRYNLRRLEQGILMSRPCIRSKKTLGDRTFMKLYCA